MGDLIFATKGQAEALAAQEEITKKAREAKLEFEASAKASHDWDAALLKLKGSAENALRSVSTEQEKIAGQIDKIKAAQEKGLIPPKEAEQAVARLRQRWIEADEATKKQREDAERVAQAHDRLKVSADAAIESVADEGEKASKKIKEIEAAIEDVQKASKEGLIPKEQGEQTIERLKDKIKELNDNLGETHEHGSRIEHAIKHAFDPVTLVKFLGGFVGVHAAIHAIEDEVEDLQKRIDKQAEFFKKPVERAADLQKEIESQSQTVTDARKTREQAQADVTRARNEDRRQRDQIHERLGQNVDDQWRARIDVAEATKKSREDNAKRIADAQRDYDRAIQDRREAADPDSVSMRRRVDDAKRNLDEARNHPDSTAIKAANDHLRELTEERVRLEEEMNASAAAVAAARERLREAAKREADEAEKYDRTVRARGALTESPDYKRGAQEEEIGKTADDLYANLVRMSKAGRLSAEQLEKFENVFRELGDSATARKLQDFVNRIKGGGTVSVDDVENSLRQRANELHQSFKTPGSSWLPWWLGGGASSPGDYATGGPRAPVEKSPEERARDEKMSEYLRRAADALDEIKNKDGTITGTSE